MRGPRCRLRTLLVAALVLAIGGGAAAQIVINREYRLKAAFLYNFGRYVHWPPAAGNQYVIGVLGKDPFGDALREIEKVGTVEGKKIVVHRFNSIADYVPCQTLFISRLASDGKEPVGNRLQAALAKTAGAPVLLVGESPGLATQGAMVNFLVQGNIVKMEINRKAAEDAGLKISSELLGLKSVTIVP